MSFDKIFDLTAGGFYFYNIIRVVIILGTVLCFGQEAAQATSDDIWTCISVQVLFAYKQNMGVSCSLHNEHRFDRTPSLRT